MMNFLFTQTPLAFLIQSFWRDEAFSYFLAKKNIFEIISLSLKDFTPPLYYLFLHFWLKIFGASEISLRSLSFIFFWATLYICFIFLEDIFRLSIRKSLLYLVLFLVNPFLSYYAFEARAYSLFAFLATLSYLSFYEKRYKLYLISTVLGLYTHYFMLFVVMSQFAFNYLVHKKGRNYEIIKMNLFKPLYMFLPWLLFVLYKKNFFTGSFWIGRINLNTLLNLPGIIYTGYENGFSFYSNRITWLSLAILILIFAALKMKNKKYSKGNQLLLYLSLWGIGIPFMIVLISLLKPIFLPRYFIFSSVGFLLLMVYLLEQVKLGIRNVIIIFLLIAAIDFQILQVRHRKKNSFQKIAREIKVLAKKDDLIYVTSELDFFTAKYYFNRQDRIYIYNKSYEEIPDFVGKVLISRKDIAVSLPSYPKKAFVLKSDGTYNIRALY